MRSQTAWNPAGVPGKARRADGGNAKCSGVHPFFAHGAYRSLHDGLKPAYENCCTCAGAAKKLAGVLALLVLLFPCLLRIGVGHQWRLKKMPRHLTKPWAAQPETFRFLARAGAANRIARSH